MHLISDLISTSAAVSPDTPGDALWERFVAEPDTLAIAVVDEASRPIGLIERHTFVLKLASRYGRALYGPRPASLLMDPAPLLAELSIPIVEFTGQALSDHPSALLKGFIAVEDGRYVGVGSTLSLLQAINAENGRQARRMTELADLLSQARDAAEGANRAKSEFLANMSHEIRTPLNGVLGVAGVLANAGLTAPQKEMVAIIESSGRALDRLLSDILDIARVESGRLSIVPEPFELHDLVREAAALFTSSARQKGIDYDWMVAEEAQVTVVGDSLRIKQILVNLISNAVKFTERGAVSVRVFTDTDGAFVFEVADTGIGFGPTEKDALFGRFAQADGSITRRFGGSGLGLAISRDLAELMSGILDADSVPGEGATFRLILPLTRQAPVVEAQADVQTETPARDLRVLVADDHETNRRVVELVLGSVGAVITSVENGEQAVAAFRRDSFDVILMDMQMPVMDGLSATRQIRRIEAATGRHRTPLLALTAHTLPEQVKSVLEVGADAHLAKPISAAALLAAVAAATAPCGEQTWAEAS